MDDFLQRVIAQRALEQACDALVSEPLPPRPPPAPPLRHTLQGQRFGAWEVVCRGMPDRDRKARWVCRCDCGKQRLVRQDYLVSGKSRSCHKFCRWNDSI